MSKLSERDLALLSTIIYCDEFVKYGNVDLQTIVTEMLKDDYPWDGVELCGDFGHIESTLDRTAAVERFKEVLREVAASKGLQNIKITSPRIDKKETGFTAACFVDANTGEATVAFRGTDGSYKQWMDNFEGAGNDDYTYMQKLAMEYIDSLSSKYSDITVTGHSKGGNLAAFVTLMCDRVSRCVSFDGQGFSEHFHEKFKTQIEENRHKIKTIASYNDFVNILMFSVSGETIYVENNKSVTGKFEEGHYITNIIFDNENNLDEYGNYISTRDQDGIISVIKKTVDTILRFVPEDMEEWFTDTFLCVASAFLGKKKLNPDDVVDMLVRIVIGAAELNGGTIILAIHKQFTKLFVDAITALAKNLVNVIKDIADGALDLIGKAVKGFTDLAASVADAALSMVSSLSHVAKDFFTDVLETAKSVMPSWMRGAFTQTENILSAIDKTIAASMEMCKKFLESFKEALKSLADKIIAGAKNVVNVIGDFVSGVVQSASDLTKSIINLAYDAEAYTEKIIKEVSHDVLSVVGSAAEKAFRYVIIEKLPVVIADTLDKIKDIFGAGEHDPYGGVDGAVNRIREILDKFVEYIKGIVDKNANANLSVDIRREFTEFAMAFAALVYEIRKYVLKDGKAGGGKAPSVEGEGYVDGGAGAAGGKVAVDLSELRALKAAAEDLLSEAKSRESVINGARSAANSSMAKYSQPFVQSDGRAVLSACSQLDGENAKLKADLTAIIRGLDMAVRDYANLEQMFK